MGNPYKALLSQKSRKFDAEIQLIVPKSTCAHKMWDWSYFNSQPIKGLREPSGAEPQVEAIAQNGAGFAHGKPLGLVEISSQGQSSWTKVHTGGTSGQ
jgi:hypothetical protein